MLIGLRSLSGFAAAKKIGRVAPQVAVLMLTMFDDDYSRRAYAIAAGGGSA